MVAAQKKLLSFLYVGCSCKQRRGEQLASGAQRALLKVVACSRAATTKSKPFWSGGSNQQTHLCHHKPHLLNPGGTQTHNPQLQRPTPHPIGHLVLRRVKEVLPKVLN